MELFEYTVYNKKGGLEKGSLTAQSISVARKELRSKGYMVKKVVSSKQPKGGLQQKGSRFLSSRLKLSDLSLCLRQLATLLNSGLELEQGLKLMSEQGESAVLKKISGIWRTDIIEGKSLSLSMRTCGYLIPESLLAAVAIGEESGHLQGVLERMSNELESSLENRQAVRSALIYPFVVIIVAIIVLYVLLAFAVPNIVKVFESSKQALPVLTQIIISISDFVSAYGFYCLVFLFLIFLTAILSLRNPQRKIRWHYFWIHRGWAGNWDRMSNVSDWCQSLGLLLSSGVPLIVALKVSNQSLSNLWLRQKFVATEEKIMEGNSLYNSIKDIDVLPLFMLHMISSGEASSELDDMLLRVGSFYRKRLSDSIKTFIQILQPAIIVLLGGLVALIITAIFMPMMNMMNNI